MKANASDLHYEFDVKIFSKLHERLGARVQFERISNVTLEKKYCASSTHSKFNTTIFKLQNLK